MNTIIRPGFLWKIEQYIPYRGLASVDVVHNLMPVEGMNHMINVVLKGGTPVTTWYMGIYEGNYTPVSGDTAATFPALASECTTYSEANRVTYVPGTVSAGAVDNAASTANFTSTSNKTIYGGFISSVASKGSTSGVLSSAVKFSTAKTFDVGTVLKVTGSFVFA